MADGPSLTVADLLPGDEIAGPGSLSAIFVAQTEHPIWPHLRLVIWRMPDLSWCHDALDIRQEVGMLAAPRTGNAERLRKALLDQH